MPRRGAPAVCLCRRVLAAAACFALLPSAAPQNIVLTQYALSPVHLVGTWYARAAHPAARIFLATHSYSDAKAFEHLIHSPAETRFLASLDVTVVPISENATAAHAALRGNYRHASGQGVVYERFCMARFVSALHIIELHNLDGVLMFDMDVATYMDLAATFGRGDWGCVRVSPENLHPISVHPKSSVFC